MSFLEVRKAKVFALFFILLGLTVIGVSIYQVRRAIFLQAQQAEKAAFKKASVLIEEKVKSFVHGLQGMSGVYLTNDFNPSPQKLRQYAVYRDFFKNFEGALGFGFVRRVQKNELKTFVAKRSKLDPRFKLKRLSDKPQVDYFIIEAIEPYENNVAALGLDIGSEAVRRLAAERALETGLNTITAPIRLVQTGVRTVGFLSFLPLYNDLTSSPDKVVGKESRLIGWSYTPFTADSLMSFATKTMDERLIMRIHDSSGAEIFTQDGEVAQRYQNPKDWLTQNITIANRTWIVNGAFRPSKFVFIVNALAILIFILFSLIHTLFVTHYFKIRVSKDESDKKSLLMQRWLQALLDGASYSIISTDPQGTITTFNKSAERMLGYRAEEMVGKKTPEAFHLASEVIAYSEELSRELGRDILPGFQTFTAKVSASHSDTQNWTYVARDGNQIPVRLCVTAIHDENKAIIGYLGVAEDLTEIIKLEKMLAAQRTKMIAASKMSALGEMAAGIAHEINSPLAIIVSWADILKMKISSGDLDHKKLLDGIQKIEGMTFRIAKIISGLRNFSRDSSLDPMVLTSSHQLIQETLELCKQRFHNNSVELIVHEDQDVIFPARSVQISQVLMNLLNNALDAVGPLSEKWVKISVRSDEKEVCFCVTDSGNGIPAGLTDKILQPFFTTKDIGKGTGLGLSISMGIVESHHGVLFYQLSEGHTQFVVKLPLK